MDTEPETIEAADVGDAASVLERDPRPVARALIPLVLAVAEGDDARAAVLQLAVALGDVGLTRVRAVAVAAAVLATGTDAAAFLANVRQAYGAADEADRNRLRMAVE